MALEHSYCAMEVRNRDWDRFICTLFAPPEHREALFTILAFNSEIARTREVVSEPILGEIRLQWWRDAISRVYGQIGGGEGEEITGHEILSALGEVIGKYDLSKSLFDRLIDARALDLTGETPEDIDSLMAYAHDSSATLNELMLEVLSWERSEEAESLLACVKEAGLAWALVGLVRATDSLSRFSRVMIPIDVLVEHGASMDDVLARKITPELSQAVKSLCDQSRSKIARARDLAPRRVKPYRSLLYPVTLAECFVKRMADTGYNPFDKTIEKGRTGRQIRLAFRALRGGF